MDEDLLDWAMQIAAAEEAARIRVEVKPEIEVTPALAPRTIIGRRTDFNIPETIIDEKGRGCLKELLVKSNRGDYKLTLVADGMTLYNYAYSWFEDVSQQLEEIDAFQTDEGDYILHISDVKFLESIKVSLEPVLATLPAEAFTINEVYWKIEIAK